MIYRAALILGALLLMIAFSALIVATADPDSERSDGSSSRRLRYMANCQDGTMTLAAVGVFDNSGNVLKTLVAPPGSLDPVTPEKGSEAAKWLRRVCMF